MSNMLEQAIADAAALREQAIKSAEQSVIEKYSRQIKEAVDQMLEGDDDYLGRAQSTIEEAEQEINGEDELPPSFETEEEIDAAPSWDNRFEEVYTRFEGLVDSLPESDDGMVEIDLGDFEPSEESADEDFGGDLGAEEGLEEPAPEGEEEGGDDLDSLLGSLQESLENEEESSDDDLNEILSILEEEVEMEIGSDVKPTGAFDVGSPNQDRAAEERKAHEALYDEEEEESSSEDDSDTKETELFETINTLSTQNKQMENVLTKLEQHLDEALLSNAKLLYQNRILGDASLNERQKTKIVEAIANAESTKEAKQLFETLKTTVGSTPNRRKGPQSLSESVNRRPNLSAMLNTRQNINESKSADNPMKEMMQRLAGIKK